MGNAPERNRPLYHTINRRNHQRRIPFRLAIRSYEYLTLTSDTSSWRLLFIAAAPTNDRAGVSVHNHEYSMGRPRYGNKSAGQSPVGSDTARRQSISRACSDECEPLG